MPIGKGYFWEGLSQGVRGLYGSMQNERMAKEAQDERAREGEKDRAGRMAQIAAVMPKPTPDTLNPDYDSVSNQLDETRRTKKAHDADFMGKSENPAKWAQESAILSQEEARLAGVAKGLSSKIGARQGVSAGGAPKKKRLSFSEQFMENEKKRGVK